VTTTVRETLTVELRQSIANHASFASLPGTERLTVDGALLRRRVAEHVTDRHRDGSEVFVEDG
jgi:hypothetical protein